MKIASAGAGAHDGPTICTVDEFGNTSRAGRARVAGVRAAVSRGHAGGETVIGALPARVAWRLGSTHTLREVGALSAT
jgi:hypothetical protein